MSSLSKNHVLFYSPQCKYCHEFIDVLNKTPYGNKFVKINVDHNNNLPKTVRSVPTIIIPTHKDVLCGNSAFMWINSIYNQTKAQNTIGEQPIPQRSNNNQNNVPQQEESDDIMPFVASEMSGNFSDGFSFIDNQNPLSHQFSFLGADENGNNQMPSKGVESTGNSRVDARIESMDQDYERMLQARNNDLTVGQPIDRR